MRVGLTGGVASGKSTVAAMLAELGAVVIDADVVAREVVAAGTPGLAAVVEEFGEDYLTEAGELDREAMAVLVFEHAEARKQLEAIIHPLVYARVAELEADADPDALVIHDIPLLVENDRAEEFDAVIVVDVPEELQIDRMVRKRGWSIREAENRIEAQVHRPERLVVADYVIDNTGTHEDLRDRVAEVSAELRRRAQQ